MSPVSRRRWANFRANRRGWYALWIFAALFGTSLVAEFIANDKPILLWMNGELHMPVINPPTEQELGGELPIEADYTDPLRARSHRSRRGMDDRAHRPVQLRHHRSLHRKRGARPRRPRGIG